MKKVFRIVDTFNITGVGTLYSLMPGSEVLGEPLFDLTGNSVKITSVARYERRAEDFNKEYPIGVLLQPEQGNKIFGTVLTNTNEPVNFLFCSDPLHPNKVEEDYAEEYEAAAVDHPCGLISFEDILEGRVVLHGEKISGLTIYRGWMLKPEQYKRMFELLEQQGIYLINTPEEYEHYHELPGWYHEFEESTAPSVWIKGTNLEDLLNKVKTLDGPYIVKDFVKSRKHEWYDACYIGNIRNTDEVQRVINNFVERQGDSLTGGIVLRKFEQLKSQGYHPESGMPISEEYRVFVYGGRVLSIDGYWQNDDFHLSDQEYSWIESLAQKVKSNYVTLDLARKKDGRLILMECGDGQVSGLQQLRPEVYYRLFEGMKCHTMRTLDDLKRLLGLTRALGIEAEISLRFSDKPYEYMIISYLDHVSFQRCGTEIEQSGEQNYFSINRLLSTELIDGIILERDWNKLEAIGCEPDFSDLGALLSAYKKVCPIKYDVGPGMACMICHH